MRRERSKTHPAASQPRPRVPEQEVDTYRLPGKLPDPTECTSCGASYREGRWTWKSAPVGSHQTCCPACRRIEDRYPAGILIVDGPFVASHREEIEGLVRHVEEREKKEHPLKRVIQIEPHEEGGLEVSTTDARLARGIGEALHHAYQGDLDYRLSELENVFRVRWTR